jgi:Concanavalin A-like lectin/glucanases superfamily
LREFTVTHTRFGTLCGLLLITAGALSAQNQGVGWWRFDETVGQVIGDASGAGNSGFLGSTTVADPDDAAWLTPGRLGPSALSFFPQNFAQVPVSNALQPTAVSVQAWVQAPDSPGTFRYIVGKGASDCTAASYALYTGPDGGAGFYIFNGSNFVVSPLAASSGVWDGAWHHLMGTFDGTTVHLFLDGVEVGSGTPANGAQIAYNLPTSNDLSIGRYGPGACALPFTGHIDEVRIWNQALTPAVISTLATKACNFVSVGVSPSTVAAGGFVTVSGRVQNCLPSSQAIVVQFDTVTPCTKSLNASIPLTLPANTSKGLTLPLFIPRGTCTGSYSVRATSLINGFPVVMSSATLNVTP